MALRVRACLLTSAFAIAGCSARSTSLPSTSHQQERSDESAREEPWELALGEVDTRLIAQYEITGFLVADHIVGSHGELFDADDRFLGTTVLSNRGGRSSFHPVLDSETFVVGVGLSVGTGDMHFPAGYESEAVRVCVDVSDATRQFVACAAL